MAEQQAGPVLKTRPGREETVNLMRVHEIRDIRARNKEGEHLGDISDVVIDHDSGCIVYTVLSYGGILGFGEKHFAIPWEAVHIRPGEKGATVDADKQTLDNATGFSRDRMPREADWSLVRIPPPARTTAASTAPVTKREVPPSRAPETAAPTETTSPGRERVVPTPPPVQTVAGGWGGVPTTQPTEERPAAPETTPVPGPGVREVHRERIPETPPHETAVKETRRESAATMETPPTTETIQPTTTARAPEHLSAADLQAHLKGMDYPAGRQDLIARAQKNNAPESVIVAIEGFSERTYRSAADVSMEFGREVRGEQPTGVEEIGRKEEARPETHIKEPSTTQRTAPHHPHLSAADFQVYLKGMDYPARKQDLMARAQKNNAPESVITTIESFSDRTYQSAADVSTEFGKTR